MKLREVDYCILMAIVRCGDIARLGDIAEESGYEKKTVETSLPRLREFHVVERHGWKSVITEKGKIALALEVGKRTQRRRRELV